MATSEASRCMACGSADGVQEFVLTIDGEALDFRPRLCGRHGDAYVLGCGQALGDIIQLLGLDPLSTSDGSTSCARCRQMGRPCAKHR